MNRTTRKFAFYLLSLVLLLSGFGATAQTPYQKPPKAVQDVLDAPSSPMVSVSPSRDRMLLMQTARYPSIAELSEPMLRLAGLRINPKTNAIHMAGRFTGLTIKTIPDGKETKVITPPGAKLGGASWSPDGKQFAVTSIAAGGSELWVGDAATGKLRKILGVKLNAAYGEALQWMPDGKTLLAQTIPAGRGAAPVAPTVPIGPTVQENFGKATPAVTFQDLMKNPHDEKLFEYYATSQLALINAATGNSSPLGKAAIYAGVDVAPDGNHLLVVSNHRPFSYTLTAGSFPREVEVWDRSGKMVHKFASLPLQDQIPIEGVATGPRGYNWRPTEPATLVWVEALDGGDTKKKASPRDVVKMLKAPFTGQPVELTKTENRFAGLTWGEKNGLVMVRDMDRNTRRSRTFLRLVDC